MTAFPKPERPTKPKARLQRKRPMRRKRARRIDRKTSQEADFLAWIHTQECAGKGIEFIVNGYTARHWCYAGTSHFGALPVEASHFRDHTGTGRKETDLTCVPLCRELHRDYDGSEPHFFKGWPLEAKKNWHRLRQAETRARWEASKR